jgi:hypothetical protein
MFLALYVKECFVPVRGTDKDLKFVRPAISQALSDTHDFRFDSLVKLIHMKVFTSPLVVHAAFT